MRRERRSEPASTRQLRLQRLEARRLLAVVSADISLTAPTADALLSTAEIQGTKWNDVDHDGVQDAGEPGISGWTIFLDQNANGVLNPGEPSTLTDSSGDYTFTGLDAGSYVVAEVNQSDWVQTFPEIDPDPNFVARYQDGVGGVEGLNGAEAIEVSPDGKHVYSASILENSVSVFSRDEVTGELTFVEVERNAQNGVDGLIAAHWLTMSEGGEHLYVSARGDDAVTLFSRDALTGELTYVESVFDGQGGVDGLNGASASAISPDGNHFYVTGRFDNKVAVFSRNQSTGQLSFLEVHADGANGVDGLDDARGLAISPDGKHVYVTALNDDSVATFSRDVNTGLLTFVEVIKDGTGGANELNGAIDATFDADGEHLYVTSVTDDSVTVFSRDDTTGQLTFLQALVDGSGGVDGLDGAIALEFNTLDELLYVAGFNDDALAIFSRDASTGLLTFEHVEVNGAGGVVGLNGSHGVDLSPDSRHIYAGAFSDDSVVAFAIAPQTHAVTLAEAEIATGLDFGNHSLLPQNLPPVLDPIGNPAPADEGTLVTFTATAVDPNAADQLSFSLDPGAPAGAAIDSVSGLFTWTPTEADGPGVFPITVRVTDDGSPALDDFETVQITVTEVNQAPVLDPIGNPSASDVGQSISFTATASDPDVPANGLTFTLDAGAPAGAAIDPQTGNFEWTPSAGQGAGTYFVTVRVTDDGLPALDDFEDLTIVVLQPGDVDGDGDVDFDDFLGLQIGFGTTSGAARSDGDLDGDGDVDFDDFLILQINFGADSLSAFDATDSSSSDRATNGGPSAPIAASRRSLAAAAVDQVHDDEPWDEPFGEIL